MEKSLDCPLPKLCPAVTLSHQDGCHSAVALLLKAALIQVSDYRLLGSLLFIGYAGFLCLFVFVLLCIFFVVLFFSPHFLQHCYIILFFFFDFHVLFVSFRLHLLIFVCICFHFVSISFDFGYYVGLFLCFLLLSLFSLILLLWKRLMVHYHIQFGLCSVRRPYMNLLSFLVYYHNIAK